MGIIIKQTIKGTVWSYLGVIVGFITTTYLYTEYLTPDIVGLFSVLLAYSILFGKLANMGMQGVIGRMFSYFRNSENGHNGFLFVGFLTQVAGFGLFLILYYLLKASIIESNLEKSALFAKYFYLLIPLTFSMMLFSFLDAFSKIQYNAVIGTFLQDFLQRLLILGIVLSYSLNLIGLNMLVIGFMTVVSLKAFIILLYLMQKGEINLKPNFTLFDKKMKSEFTQVALFSLVGSFGSVIVFSIDKILVNQFLDLSNVGVYTIAFYFGTLVSIPSRSLLKISGTLIADSFKNNDLENVNDIYSKSCITQLIIGLFLFMGIWVNIESVLLILGDDYLESKWVIFFIGIGYLIDMSTGANGSIISLSKYFRYNMVFLTVLIGITVGVMYVLIPMWGIVGAAISIAIALFVNNLMRYLFILKKFGFQPFNWNFVIVIAAYILLYFVVMLIPTQPIFLDLFLRSVTLSVLTFLVFYISPLSPDIKELINTMLTFGKQKLSKWM